MKHSIPDGKPPSRLFGNCSCAPGVLASFHQSSQAAAAAIAGLREVGRQAETIVAAFKRLQASVPAETVASVRKIQECAAANHGAEMLAILNRKEEAWKLDLK